MYKNILVPVAPDHGAVIGNSMKAARALLAPGGTITVLTVIEAIPSYISQYLPQDQQDRNVAETEAQLAAEFAGQDGVGVLVKVGHAAQTILDVAEEAGHDCVVIASHRPGLQDYFLGSTAARVVRHAQCGVHVLR
ncbi:Nucleotide-binding universal stress protein, UspA family [Gemmobacter megaterium]|uniref:Nucleotide-binding universal stress protein, UspA family n=1 Tax=Gemmobacter megaterium TaxID=1086013 RepID=A0A1N7P9F5_9RHOB|nr:universal stress protein [Gemmobacter megaterium]GGE19648.1 universal stress protein [Gemmobacter megaterium]SIT07188.1 Nucleotide-binding universal stress protein, UspA family [Gemmobacter megaterium]